MCTKYGSYNTYTFIHANIHILQSKWLRNSNKIKKKANKDVKNPQKINDISLYWILIHWVILSTGKCHKVQISSKITNLDSSLWAFKTCEVPFNPSASSSAYLRIPHNVFPIFSLFLNFKEVFQRLFWLWLVIAMWFLLMASPPFIIPSKGFWCTTDSLHLLPWVLGPMLCQQHWWLVSSLFSYYVFILRFSSKKSPADLLLGGPKGWLSILSFQSF